MEWVIKTFSEFELPELYELMKLRQEVFVVEQECAYLDADGYDSDAIHVMARKDSKLIAYARILKAGVKYQELAIGRVLVSLEERGKSLGYELMERTLAYALEHGERSVRISAQVYLQAFYETLGFKVQGSEYLEDGIPHQEMLLVF